MAYVKLTNVRTPREEMKTRIAQLKTALKEMRDCFMGAFRASSDAMCVIRSADNVYADMNEGFFLFTGYPRERVIGARVSDLDFWADAGARDRIIDDIKKGGFIRSAEAKFRFGDDSLRTGLVSGQSIVIGRKPHVLLAVHDITDVVLAEDIIEEGADERTRVQRLLEESRKRNRTIVKNTLGPILMRFRALFEGAPTPIFVTDQAGRFLDANGAALQFLNQQHEDIVGAEIWDFIPAHKAAAYRLDSPFSNRTSGEMTFLAGGKPRTLLLNVVSLNLSDAAFIYMIGQDVTAQKEAEAEARRFKAVADARSLYDPLTGLPGRRLFADRLEQAILRARARNRLIILLRIRLNGFRRIRRRFGDLAAEDAVGAAARKLTTGVKETDTAARFEGEEFAVMLQNIRDAENADAIARRLHAALSAPAEIGTERLPVGVAMGVSAYPEDGGDAETLMQKAGSAMNYVQKFGKNGYRRFDAMCCFS